MLAVVKSLALVGMEAAVIQVEVDVSTGLPSFDLVGLPDASVKESRERVRTAIKNAGFDFPAKRITVNLAPADLRKEGSAFDLPIAIGILASTGQLEGELWRQCFFAGELSLKGELRGIPGVLSMALTLAEASEDEPNLIIPQENGFEGALVRGVSLIPTAALGELVDYLEGKLQITQLIVDAQQLFTETSERELELNFVRGQGVAKRGLEIAAAGGHNVLLIGPPGSGKTMLAKGLTEILPPLSLAEALEVSRIYSVAGLLKGDQPLITQRPFRTPHHTASTASVIGGGRNPRPGEISLATHGLLFLDELLEFRRDVLEALRQPLEDRQVTVSRVQGSYNYPANFMLLGTANPCPCGFSGDRERECRCTPHQIQRYRSKLSGPLLDRIDLQIEVPRLTLKELQTEDCGEDGALIKARVMQARERQRLRLQGTGWHCNAQIKGSTLRRYCQVTSTGLQLLEKAFTQLNLSMRAYDRLLKIALTIADLMAAEEITAEHIGEALQYRLWNEDASTY